MTLIPQIKKFLTKYLTPGQLKLVMKFWTFVLNIPILKNFHSKSRTSYGHSLITNVDLDLLNKKYSKVWQDSSIPEKQLKLSQKQLLNYEDDVNMTAAIKLIKMTNLDKKKDVLEIGCSTGYYSEIFKRAGLNVKYQGCDYSEEFIKQARIKYPETPFKLTDATDLDYGDAEFDIVISGCCILHIIDYNKAISETARVTKEWAIFHRTPIVHLKETSYFKKIGYNLEMLEIIFNEEGLIKQFYKNNLLVHQIVTLQIQTVKDLSEPVFIKSYLCKKF